MKGYKIFLVGIGLLSLASCEKEIEVDVDRYDPVVVIEAKISNRPGDAMVHLTQSLPLNEDIAYPSISNAEVTITDMDTEEVYRLYETEEGVYKNPSAIGMPNHIYNLKVLLTDGRTFSSVDIMPEPVDFSAISYELFEVSFGDDEDDEEYFEVVPEFLDTSGVDNYYQLIVIQEGEGLEDINVFKDLGFDGLPNTQRIFFEANYGDEIQFDLHNISEDAYEYLLGVAYNLSQSSATPTNPISNISGGALGYFKAYSAVEPITLVLTEDNAE